MPRLPLLPALTHSHSVLPIASPLNTHPSAALPQTPQALSLPRMRRNTPGSVLPSADDQTANICGRRHKRAATQNSQATAQLSTSHPRHFFPTERLWSLLSALPVRPLSLASRYGGQKDNPGMVPPAEPTISVAQRCLPFIVCGHVHQRRYCQVPVSTVSMDSSRHDTAPPIKTPFRLPQMTFSVRRVRPFTPSSSIERSAVRYSDCLYA